jgi:hypothetical protein
VKREIPAYVAPEVIVLGKVEVLTLACNKDFGGADGFTFQQSPISCTSP